VFHHSSDFARLEALCPVGDTNVGDEEVKVGDYGGDDHDGGDYNDNCDDDDDGYGEDDDDHYDKDYEDDDDVEDDDIYIMVKCLSVCLSVTKNDHFL